MDPKILKHDHQTLKSILKNLPENRLYLLQMRDESDHPWKTKYRQISDFTGTYYLHEFLTVKQFTTKVKYGFYCQFRIVRISRYLTEGSVEPAIMEMVEFFPKRN
jgi:Iap family predicted aminopeptidase